jgi:LysR family nitrogen assimilation transcriptional regulator
MNVRHLRYFIEVTATGSLRRASEVLYVTQSALSRAIAELESDLGCALLERHQRGVRPTPQGLALAQRARRIVSEMESLKAQVLAEGGGPVGHVRLAMPVGMRDLLTRPLVRRLRKDYPNIRVDVADGNAHENRAAVLEGEADVAVIQELDRGLPLNYRRMYVDSLCLVGPRSAGFGFQKQLPLSALAGPPLLLIRPPNQIRWTVDAALRRLMTTTEPAMEVSSSMLLLDLVEDGHGYTVLPQSLVLEAVKHRPLSAGPVGKLNVTWVTIWQKGKPVSPAVRATLDALHAISAQLPAVLKKG